MNIQNKNMTSWGSDIDCNCPLSEYPRPQLVRDNWRCFNGEWDYAITLTSKLPEQFDGSILVPFSPESILSGVDKQLKHDQFLWYRRFVTFSIPEEGRRVLLHFGAVDQVCEVYFNGKLMGSHEGGYWPFKFDITDFIRDGINTIAVCVRDIGDLGDEAYGNQKASQTRSHSRSQSGIWQTVWSEEVSEHYVERIKINTNIKKDYVSIELIPSTTGYKFEGEIKIKSKGVTLTSSNIFNNRATIPLVDYILWDLENPYLYDLSISAGNDKFTSYFGMREFDKKITSDGFVVPTLNGKPIFLNAVQDNGYWPDGMYTAPKDAALVWDIQAIKDLGFNAINKHSKIESLRWYYHCDRLGILVMQDFVEGGGPFSSWLTSVAPKLGVQLQDNAYKTFGRESQRGRNNFERDLVRTVELLYNVVSLAVWIPFHNAQGQFDAERIASEVHRLDDTRLIDHASGFHDQRAGDFYNQSAEVKPFRVRKDKNARIFALIGFGRYTRSKKDTIEIHSKNIADMYKRRVLKNLDKGLSVLVFNQLSDIPGNETGIYNAKRNYSKIDEDMLKDINHQIYKSFYKNINKE